MYRRSDSLLGREPPYKRMKCHNARLLMPSGNHSSEVFRFETRKGNQRSMLHQNAAEKPDTVGACVLLLDFDNKRHRDQ